MASGNNSLHPPRYIPRRKSSGMLESAENLVENLDSLADILNEITVKYEQVCLKQNTLNVNKRIFRHMRPAKIQISLRIRDLIRIFTWYSLASQRGKVSSCGQRRLRSGCVYVQDDLRFCWAHMSKDMFSHVVDEKCFLFSQYYVNRLTKHLYDRARTMKYSRTSIARTLMARLPWLIRARF